VYRSIHCGPENIKKVQRGEFFPSLWSSASEELPFLYIYILHTKSGNTKREKQLLAAKLNCSGCPWHRMKSHTVQLLRHSKGWMCQVNHFLTAGEGLNSTPQVSCAASAMTSTAFYVSVYFRAFRVRSWRLILCSILQSGRKEFSTNIPKEILVGWWNLVWKFLSQRGHEFGKVLIKQQLSMDKNWTVVPATMHKKNHIYKCPLNMCVFIVLNES
jgi:hypothetical protein